MTSDANPLRLLLRKLQTHAPLEEGDREAILALPWTRRKLDAHSYIVREGEAPTMCGVLISGFAYRQKLTGEGTRQIVSLHIPGEPLGFQNFYLAEADHSVQALTSAEVAWVDRHVLQELVYARSGIARAIFIVNLVEASIFREWILNVGRRQAQARVAHVLCEMGVRLEAQGLADNYGYELPMTQEQLADVVGLTSVHVNRTLKALEGRGLIHRDRRRISFPDWQALSELGDFNPRYLHLEPQRTQP